MTRRAKKKLMKRMGYKKYSNYRLHIHLSKVVEACYNIGDVGLILMTTGRKANNTCIHSVELFTNVYPVSINSGGGIKYNNDTTITFDSKPISNDIIEQKAEELITNVNRKELG